MHFFGRNTVLLFAIALVFWSVLPFNDLKVTCDQVYQPVQSEIDRFKMIQEKIQQQQQQDQQQEQQQEQHEQQSDHRPSSFMDSSVLARHHTQHPLLTHLINRLTGQPPPQFMHPSPMMQESQMAVQQQHHLPEQMPSGHGPTPNHMPILPQFPQVPLSHQQLAQQQSQQHQLDPSSSLQNAPSINPDSFRMLMHKNLALPGEMPSEINSKHYDGGDENSLETKNNDGAQDFAEKERDDKHHRRDQHRGHHSSIHGPRRCYACSWSIAQCADFNCYNNPDICTNNHFKPHRVHQADCPSGCEQYVVTDPNGLIQTWKRGCAPPSLPIKGYRCKTHYEFGIRIDRCICNLDWCNPGDSIHHKSTWLLMFSLCLHWLLSRLF